MNDTALHQVALELPSHAAHPVSDLLEGLDHPAALSVSMFEIPNTSNFKLEAIYPEPLDRDAFVEKLGPLLDALDLPLPDIRIAPVPDRNWVAESLRGLPPVVAGRFFVAGSHDISSAGAGGISLCIDAAEAFGTGHHATTSTCLLALDRLGRTRRFRSVLDLGCGTGVLAMAAAKLWRQPVIASDIDPVAVRVTQENARRNGLSALIKPVVASGFDHPAIKAAGPYDLIVANILARPLVKLATPLSRHLAVGGHIVLSGLLREQEASVLSAYRAHELHLLNRLQMGDWVTLTLN